MTGESRDEAYEETENAAKLLKASLEIWQAAKKMKDVDPTYVLRTALLMQVTEYFERRCESLEEARAVLDGLEEKIDAVLVEAFAKAVQAQLDRAGRSVD